MKETRKEPVFLLEMPHALRLLIMKRGYMLRSERTRTLMCVGKSDAKSWLEAKLISSSEHISANCWDEAHKLAARFKRELHKDVYVEPQELSGRFKDLTAVSEPEEYDIPADFLPKSVDGSMGFGPEVGMGNAMFPSSGSQFGVGAGFGARRDFGGDMFGFGAGSMQPGMPNIPGMPHIPDPMKDLLPESVRQAMGMGRDEKKPKAKKALLKFPALAILPGWSELPEEKRAMFEVEAAQLRRNKGGLLEPEVDNRGLVDSSKLPRTAEGDEKALAALSADRNISETLKRYLLENFEAVTVRNAVS